MSTPLLANILDQPKALQAVLDHQFGAGRADLERSARLLRSRTQVVVSGMGASYFACLPFEYLLAKRGFIVNCIEAAELLYFRPRLFANDSAYVFVSRSGESVEVIKLMAHIEGPSGAVIGLTNVDGSSLVKDADCSILLNSPADQMVAIQTYVATIAALVLLDAAVADELEQARLELEQTIKILEASIPQWVESRKSWKAFLEGGAPIYLLARGPSLGTVAESVLLMHEVAKSSAVGMSIPQFRHGPVEAVDGNFHAVILGTQPLTQDLDAALSNDLIQMGGEVRWLGPQRPDGQCQSLCLWPGDVPERFACIVETIPLQLLAYTKAELRGITPGDFRWAPAITSSEAGFPMLRPA